MFAQLKQVRENVSSLRELIESRGTGQVCVARSLTAAFHAARHAATHADPCMCISLHAYKTCALTQRHPPAHRPTPTHTHMATPLRTQEYVDSLRNTMDTVENDIFVVRQGHHAKFEALSAEEQQLSPQQIGCRGAGSRSSPPLSRPNLARIRNASNQSRRTH